MTHIIVFLNNVFSLYYWKLIKYFTDLTRGEGDKGKSNLGDSCDKITTKLTSKMARSKVLNNFDYIVLIMLPNEVV